MVAQKVTGCLKVRPSSKCSSSRVEQMTNPGISVGGIDMWAVTMSTTLPSSLKVNIELNLIWVHPSLLSFIWVQRPFKNAWGVVPHLKSCQCNKSVPPWCPATTTMFSVVSPWFVTAIPPTALKMQHEMLGLLVVWSIVCLCVCRCGCFAGHTGQSPPRLFVFILFSLSSVSYTLARSPFLLSCH